MRSLCSKPWQRSLMVTLADERTSGRWAESINKHFCSLSIIPIMQVNLFIQQNALPSGCVPGTMLEPVIYKEVIGLRKPIAISGNRQVAGQWTSWMIGTPMVVKWWTHCSSTAAGVGLIPGWGTKILYAVPCSKHTHIHMHGMIPSLSRVRLFVTPWTVARQDPLSMGFPRQEYWSGLSFPLPRDVPASGIESESPVAPALPADSSLSEPSGKRLFKKNLGW